MQPDIDFSTLSVDDCPLCQMLIEHPDATRCSVCNKPLCVEHIKFTWNPATKRAKRYYCPEHYKEGKP